MIGNRARVVMKATDVARRVGCEPTETLDFQGLVGSVCVFDLSRALHSPSKTRLECAVKRRSLSVFAKSRIELRAPEAIRVFATTLRPGV